MGNVGVSFLVSQPLAQRKMVHAICVKTLQITGFQRFSRLSPSSENQQP
jgi:hypothetical protein